MKPNKHLLISLFICIFSLFNPTSSYAISNEDFDFSNEDYYLETIIENNYMPLIDRYYSTFSTTNYITKTKTTNCKNSSGDIIWSLSITATFSYDGNSVNCVRYTPKATINSPYWSYKNFSSCKTYNSASVSADFVYSPPFVNSFTLNESVSINCTPSGNVY